MKNTNIYVDMDGVQAVYGVNDSVETMSEIGYFRNRPVQKNVIDFIKMMLRDQRFHVSILSAVFQDEHSATEKKQWLVENGLGGVKTIFTPCGARKGDYVDGDGMNILIDDYSRNLIDWETCGENFKGIKFDNGINGTKGTWKKRGGIVLSKELSAGEMYGFMRGMVEK